VSTFSVCTTATSMTTRTRSRSATGHGTPITTTPHWGGVAGSLARSADIPSDAQVAEAVMADIDKAGGLDALRKKPEPIRSLPRNR
jgi:hypothetical protein